jgi:mycobactin peptide synthetase MbtE
MSRLIARLDGPRIDYPLGRQIWPYVQRHAELTPNAPACIQDAHVLTYKDLIDSTDAVAERLIRAGLRSGEITAVIVPRSEALLVTLLAITRIGAGYLAIDERWVHARVSQAIEVARCGHVLIGRDCRSVADLLGSAELLDRGADGATAHNVCCVYFTSGSSGAPKAAAAPATGILRIALDPAVRFSPRTRMLQLAVQSWDAFSLEAWCPLINGGTCVIHTESFPTVDSIELLKKNCGLNTVFLTTALFNLFVDESPEVFAGLESVMFGGERVSRKHVGAFRKAHPETYLLHAYGPVESSIFATVYQIPPVVGSSVPIGSPVANTSVLLVTDEQGETDEAVQGEIVLAGDGLAYGYIGDPGQTARNFAVRPGIGRQGEWLYLTGDFATLAGTDGLVFHGRKDSQLKINGVRIEPDELRYFAESMPEVARSVVVGVPVHAPNKTGTVLFYSLRPGHVLERQVMRKRIVDHFPASFVPLAVVQVDSVPLGESGKTSSKNFKQTLEQLRIAPVATRDLQDIAILENKLITLLNGER